MVFVLWMMRKHCALVAFRLLPDTKPWHPTPVAQQSCATLRLMLSGCFPDAARGFTVGQQISPIRTNILN
jgi:hypothetical protein